MLGKAKYFSKLDLHSGYWQIAMDDESKEKTAFTCHLGLYDFNRLPFGISTAPSVFQELMNRVLEGLNNYSIAYLDDILIYSENLSQHLEHIQQVFDRLRQLSPAVARKYILLDNILFFISKADTDPILRLCIPKQLQSDIISEYHSDLGHMGIDKTYSAKHSKYYWLNLYKDVTDYVNKCVTCQLTSSQQPKPPIQEMDISPFAFAKLGLDCSGPYPTSLSGNRYITSFIDLYSGWIEAFACPEKSAQTIAQLLIEEIFPRFSCPLELLTENGSENVNQVMKETLAAMNIHHVTTSFYHPKSAGMVERSHRTLISIIS